MKQLTATCLLIGLLPCLVAAQPRTDYFFHQHQTNTIYPRMIEVHPDGYFVTGNAVVPLIDACETSAIFFWDEEFELSTVAYPANSYGEQLHITASAWRGDTLFALGQVGCNYDGMDRDFSALLAYTKQGELLYSVDWPNCLMDITLLYFTLSSSRCPVMGFDEAGLLYVALENGLYAFSDPQDFPQEVASGLNMDRLTGLAALPGQRMAVCSPDSVRLLDLAAEQILWSTPAFVDDMAVVDSTLWFISSDSLYRLSAELNLDAWPLPVESHLIRMAAHENGPLLHAPVGPSHLGWQLNPSTGAFELTFDWPRAGLDVLAIAPTGQDSCYLSGLWQGRPFLKQTPFDDFQFVPKFDVGVAQVELIDILQVEATPDFGDLFSVRVQFVVEAIVENYGTQPVQAFQLDWPFRHGPFCFYPGLKLFGGLDFLPGDRLVIRDTLFYFAIAPLPAFAESVPLSLATYAPNHYSDANMDNDTAFYELAFTALQEAPLVGTEARLFPNPARGVVQVEANTPLQGFELYDGLGRRLRQAPLHDAVRFELQREGLPAGVYSLRLSVRSGEVVKRFVWLE